MKAWRDLQKDLESRKYKSNPFEKKYVDLTTSLCIAGDPSTDDTLGLDHLSKSIRARSDIINCQINFLVKEATNLTTDLSIKGQSTTSTKKQIEENGAHNYFTYEKNLPDSRRCLLEKVENGTPGQLPDEVMNARLPWLESLVKTLEESKIKEILAPFCKNGSDRCIVAENDTIEHSGQASLFNCSATEAFLITRLVRL